MRARQDRHLRIWALLGARLGDNNQVLALAEALGVRFQQKVLRYNYCRHLQPPLLGATFRSLTRESRQLIGNDWPDLTISAGHRSVPVVQAIRKASDGRTQSVHVGYPRISPAKFDLVIATPEYPIRDHPNLLRIPFALTRPANQVVGDFEFRDAFPGPRRLLILGGPTLYWELDAADILDALGRLLVEAKTKGGSVLVIGSPRTPRRLLREIALQVSGVDVPAALVPIGGDPSYRTLLAEADSILVTADSTAMISDAIATRKPVGLVPLHPSLLGRASMALMDRLRPGQRIRPRDLRFVWSELRSSELVGTVEQPKRGEVPELSSLVATRVWELLRR